MKGMWCPATSATMISRVSPHKFVQSNPYQHCPRNDPRHRNWRCSIQCYRNAAYKEHKCMMRVLDGLPDDMRVYFGTLTVARDQTEAEVLKTRKDFLKLLNVYSKDNCISVCQLRGVTEIGERSGRHHHHYCIYVSDEIDQQTIRHLWAEVTPPGSTRRVSHDSPRESTAVASSYMWKFDPRHKILLPCYGSIDVTWGTKRFFGPGGKVSRWTDYKQDHFAPADPSFFGS
jgi:hypothetical protein